MVHSSDEDDDDGGIQIGGGRATSFKGGGLLGQLTKNLNKWSIKLEKNKMLKCFLGSKKSDLKWIKMIEH